MLKKIMASVLAAALAFALAAPAFALLDSSANVGSGTTFTGATADSSGAYSPGTDGSVTISMTSQQNIPTLTIKIDGKSGVVLNPYGLEVKNDVFTTRDTASASSHAQVLGNPFKITNNSTVPVSVAAKFTATVADGINLVGAPNNIASTEKDKKMFVAMVVGTAKEAVTGLDSSDMETYNDSINSEIYTFSATENPYGAKLVATTNGTAVEADPMFMINGTAPNNVAYLGATGCMTRSPDSAWTTNDTLTISLELTFKLSV